MLRAKPQYVVLLIRVANEKYVQRKKMKKKVCPKLESNSVPGIVSPVLYQVSYREVLIGPYMLLRLLLT